MRECAGAQLIDGDPELNVPQELFLSLETGHSVLPPGGATYAPRQAETEAVGTGIVEPDFGKAVLSAAGESPGFNAFSAVSELLLRMGDVRINLVTRCVARGECIIKLRPREFSLLACLVSNAPTVLDRPTLHEKVWGYHFDPRTNVVESHISRLRAKLDRTFTVKLIETVRGVGYRFRAPY